jgi:hypothetical protein
VIQLAACMHSQASADLCELAGTLIHHVKKAAAQCGIIVGYHEAAINHTDVIALLLHAPCRSEPTYVSWLARCLIMSGKAAAAWLLYQVAQDTGSPAAAGEEGYSQLQLIANDCYKMGAFYYALKVGSKPMQPWLRF